MNNCKLLNIFILFTLILPSVAFANKTNKNKIKLKSSQRLFLLYSLKDDNEGPLENTFSVSSARISLQADMYKFIKMEAKYDLSNIMEWDSPTEGFRDIYVKLSPYRWLNIKAGQFKRPFNQIELTSKRDLPMVERGHANDYIISHLNYGGRDIGFMLSGKFFKKNTFSYDLGFFNGMGSNTGISSSGFSDIVLKLSQEIKKHLTFNAGISLRHISSNDVAAYIDPSDFTDIEDKDFPLYMYGTPEEMRAGFKEDFNWLSGNHIMFNGSGMFKKSGFSILLDAMIGDNWWYEHAPYVGSLTSVASYIHRFKSKFKFKIEPAIGLEMLSVLNKDLLWLSRMYSVKPALNLHFTKYIKVMIEGNFTFTQGTEDYFDEKPYKGFWPGEWPGSFAPEKELLIQLAYSM